MKARIDAGPVAVDPNANLITDPQSALWEPV
jgi:hypothetical protein